MGFPSSPQRVPQDVPNSATLFVHYKGGQGEELFLGECPNVSKEFEMGKSK